MNFIKRIPQCILGIALIFTGVSHLTTRRLEFQAQVPTQLQQWANEVVLASGVVEIALGIGLLVLWKYRVVIGWLTAIFFVAIPVCERAPSSFAIKREAARSVPTVIKASR